MLTELVYVYYRFTSTPDKENNKYYLGPAPLDDMARYVILRFPPRFIYVVVMAYPSVSLIFAYPFRQIATAHGPCGNNRDYLFLLEKAMHNIGKLSLFVWLVHDLV